ncbi:MAG: zinc ribbon-containing protein [Desulfobulbaceae bacterium]|nr:zinc ribbon-containing protein [Desulfobulbaceae bacterium]
MEPEKKETQATEEELATYEKLRQQLSKRLGELNEKINSETISQAMDKAMADLKGMGEHSREAVARAGDALKKDIASTVENVKPKIDKVTTPAREQFDHWLDKGGQLWRDIANEAGHFKEFSRDKGAAFLLNITRGLNDWSSDMKEKLDTSLQYKTGEMTHGGEFICTSCEGKIHLKKPGRIPPCPKCSKSEFRRS